MSAKATLARENHVYTANGSVIPLSISQVLSLAGIVQPYPESARFNVMRAGELGTTVHEWADWLDSDDVDVEAIEACDPVVLPYVQAYQSFRVKHCPVWSHVEQSFWDEELKVAGTPDRIGTIEINGLSVPAIIDFKTAKTVAAYWPIQLSGYSVLSGRLEHGLYVLRLAQDASFKLIPYQSDTETFLAAVKIAQWRLAHGGKP